LGTFSLASFPSIVFVLGFASKKAKSQVFGDDPGRLSGQACEKSSMSSGLQEEFFVGVLLGLARTRHGGRFSI
jgi:hypothetical protein